MMPHRNIRAMVQGGTLAALFLSASAASAITLDDLYKQSGVERLPARVPTARAKNGVMVPLTRSVVGGPVGLAIGVGLAYVQYQADQAEMLRVQMGSNNGRNLPTPAGFSDPDTPINQPASTSTLYRYTYGGQTYSNWRTASEAGVDLCGRYQNPSMTDGKPTYKTTGYSRVHDNYVYCQGLYMPSNPPTDLELSTGISVVSYSASGQCSDGYALSDNNCVRVSPVWPQDGVATLAPNAAGNGWTNHVRDGDKITDLGTRSVVQINGKDTNGNPTIHTLTTNADNTVTLNILTEIPKTGGSDVDSWTFTTNRYGDVINSTATAYYNTTINNISQLPVVNADNPQPVEIDFPDDYARENTLQSIKTDTNKLASGEMTATIDPAADHGLADFTAQVNAVGGDDPAWIDWIEVDSLFPNLSCSLNLNWSFKGAVVDYGNLCSALEVVRSILGWIIAIFTIAGLYALVGEAMRVRT